MLFQVGGGSPISFLSGLGQICVSQVGAQSSRRYYEKAWRRENKYAALAQVNQSLYFLVWRHNDRKRVVLQKWLFCFVIQAHSSKHLSLPRNYFRTRKQHAVY